jgi:hypothetical protein
VPGLFKSSDGKKAGEVSKTKRLFAAKVRVALYFFHPTPNPIPQSLIHEIPVKKESQDIAAPAP